MNDNNRPRDEVEQNINIFTDGTKKVFKKEVILER